MLVKEKGYVLMKCCLCPEMTAMHEDHIYEKNGPARPAFRPY